MTLEHISPQGLAKSPAYTHVVRTSGTTTAYIAGQVALDADGNVVGEGDLEAQARQAYANLVTALAAVGATVNEIAKTTTYVVNYSADVRPALHAARRSVFSGEPPANTLIGVQSLALPEFLIEIEAIAVLD